MSARVTLVAHSSTSATVSARFADDESLDERGAAWAASALGRLRAVTRTSSSPARACRETSTALGLTAEVDPQLRDWDLGCWRGSTLDEVAAAEPAALQTWLTEPGGSPHGGEPLTGLLDRVAAWLAAVPSEGHTVAVTHPAVVRAAVLTTLGGSPAGFWRIDIAPLTATDLRGGPGRWTIRSTGLPLDPR